LNAVPTVARAMSVVILTIAVAGLSFASPPTPTTRSAGLHFHLENAGGWDPAVRAKIEKAMTEAVKTYNDVVVFDFDIPVAYSPQTPTADANYQGHIRFGGQIGTRTAMHEIGHILGVGTAPRWSQLVRDGKWTGPAANRQLRELDGPDAVLHADRQHFWPYGLNYDKEGATLEQRRRHVLMVAAIRADLGLDVAAAH